MNGKRRRVALGLLVGLAAAIGLRGKLRRYEVREASMKPALRSGDYIVATATSEPLTRGSIVIFPHPEVPGFELIKRVIGLPGERVSLHNGQVHIDGSVLAEPWADGPVRPDGEWLLDAHSVYVLGDNRPVSAADSRTIGPIALDSVRWKAAARYWPPGRLGRLPGFLALNTISIALATTSSFSTRRRTRAFSSTTKPGKSAASISSSKSTSGIGGPP